MTHRINENILITSSKFIEQRAYWQAKLEDITSESKLPIVRQKISGSENGSVQIDIPLDETFGASVIKFARGSDIALYIVLAAALKTLIFRYTGNDDVIIISPVLREYVNSDTMNHYLFIRDALTGSETFKELLHKVKDSILNAYDHQDYPLEKLLEILLDKQADQDSNRISEVVCLLENIHAPWEQTGGKNKLVFSFRRDEDTLRGQIKAEESLYDPEYLKLAAGHLALLLKNAVAQADEQIFQIPLLPEKEKEKLLLSFNADQKTIKDQGNELLHRLFERQVERTPEAIAVLMSNTSDEDLPADGIVSITYRNLNRRAEQLARLLRSSGVVENNIVGLMTERSIETVVGIFGILKAGGAYLPIDSDFPEHRVKYIMNDSAARILITTRNLSKVGDAEDVQWFAKAQLGEVTIVFMDTHNDRDEGELKNADIPISTSSPVYIIYTSGSTGNPKGVLVEHRNVTAYVAAFLAEFHLNPLDTVMQQASASFDAFVEEVFPILSVGGKLAVPRNYEITDMNLLSAFIVEKNITMISCTPLLLNEIDKFETPNKVRIHISGGDELKPEHVSGLVGKSNVYNTYGPTESTVCITYYKCTSRIGDFLPIGKPISGYQVYILDTNRFPVPLGVPGEICVAGVGVARGYLNQPELSSEKFIKNTFAGGTVYRTGDLGRWLLDGNIQFLGRIDNQVKIRGFRIELNEIEECLTSHPQIEATVVIVWEDETGDKSLCAYYQGRSELELLELRTHLAVKLPDYMVPSYFVYLKKIPVTASGKPNRRELPAPEIKTGTRYAPPGNNVEARLLTLWSEVLGIGDKRIGIDDNFFDMGGHSLKATVLISRIHKAFDVKIPLKTIFDAPTVRSFAKFIVTPEKEAFEVIANVEEQEYYQLSSAQLRLYILQEMELHNTVYNMPMVIVLPEAPEIHKLQEVFKQLVRRHESLRTSFHMMGDQPVQKVHSVDDVQIAFEYYEYVNDAAILEFVRPFDLSRPPLVRVGLGRDRDKGNLLLLDMHHIISDGVSMYIIRKDFSALYEGAQLPELRVQYKDYALWRNSPHQRRLIAQQESYWLKEFAGSVPLLNMPIDFPRPEKIEFKGSSIIFTIEGEQNGKIKTYISKANVTLLMFLISLYNVLLARYTGQEDIIVGTVVAGRRHTQLENIIGFFVNMLPIYTKVKHHIPFSRYLDSVREKILNAFENQDYPFEELVTKLEMARFAGRHPLIDTVFVLSEEGEPSVDEGGTYDGDSVLNSLKKTHFDLMFHVDASRDSITVTIEYSTALFKESTIKELAGAYLEILDQVLQNRDVLLGDVKITHDMMESAPGLDQDALDDWEL